MERIKLKKAEKVKRSKPQNEILKNIKTTGDMVEDSKKELDVIQTGFKERMRQEQKRFQVATDSEYWACFIFQDRQQKETFLKALKLLELGDKYIDGQAAARQLGIELKNSPIKYNISKKVDPKLLDLVG